MNTKKKDSKGYVLHLPMDLMERIREIAVDRGEPVSVIIREALREYLRADRTYEIHHKAGLG